MNLIYLLSLAVLCKASSPQNANHIFNAIHSSMRQWGSSLHHNGMSFFLASVPKGTKLYHGSSREGILHGVGWMAFDPEHAMVFARGSSPSPRSPINNPNGAQKVLQGSTDNAGYLHTYDTRKDLRLIYIDGLSAGKSQIGTLDSQDRILFGDRLPRGGVTVESDRADEVCRLASDEWEGRIDGVIRMAAGFEIILCNPESNLLPVRISKTVIANKPQPQNRGEGKKGGKPGELMRVVTSRYDGIGGDRVVVNYDHFVSAFDSGLDLFSNGLPRLSHLDDVSLRPIREQLTSLVMDHDVYGQINWQAITDMTIKQYGRRLRDLVSRFSTMESLSYEITRIWAPFMDLEHLDRDDEIHRCATRFLPDASPSLSYRAVFAVNERICLTLATVMDEKDHTTAIGYLSDLMDYLQWSTWKECRGCGDDEFCAIPIWPQGSKEDYENPKCQPFDSAYVGVNDYWGDVWR